VRVPLKAAGQARLTLSLPDWQDRVAPAVFKLPIRAPAGKD
jgi:hypothetical protein